MRVLVTGHRGYIGTWVWDELSDCDRVGFSIEDGDDVRDEASVRKAVAGCDAVVHLAAIAHDSGGTPAEIFATNVIGTLNVLGAAVDTGTVERFVYFSSAQVFGIAEGERRPDYFPIDDDHPLRAARPYGMSKRFGEDLCEAATERTGITTICLRPVAVWTPETYDVIRRKREEDPTYEWHPFWEYGAFVDVRDVATAVRLALTQPVTGHHRLLLCAANISATEPTRTMTARLMPEVPWRAGASTASEAYSALADASRARAALGWEPRHGWQDAERL